MSWTSNLLGGAAALALAGAMAGMAQPTVVTEGTAQQAVRQASETKGALVFEEERLDIGVVHDGGKIDVEFPFKNEGDIPIMITNVKPSCGCTDPEFEPVVQPGDTSAIKAKFNPTGKVGPSTVSIKVETDDPERPTINLILQATVEPIVKAEPSIVQLGDLRKGESKRMTTAVSGEMDGFQVRFATTSSPLLMDVSVVEHAVEGEGELARHQSTLEVLFKGRSEIGPISETVLARTNDDRRRLLPIKVIGRVVGDVQIVPDRVGLGVLRPGQPFERTLRVTSRSGEAFEILGVEPRVDIDDEFQVEILPGADGKGYELRIHGTTSEDHTQRRPVRGKLLVRTNVPGEEVVELNMYGSIRPAGAPTRRPPR